MDFLREETREKTRGRKERNILIVKVGKEELERNSAEH